MSKRRVVRYVLLCSLAVAAAALAVAFASGWSANVTSALGFVFGPIALLVAVVLAMIAMPAPDLVDLSKSEDSAADRLAERVREQWIDERNRRDRTRTIPVEVRFHAERDGPLGANPDDLLLSDDDASGVKEGPRLMDDGTLKVLHRLYLLLPRGRMVIVGDGGTGKTEGLIRLVIKSLSERGLHPENPVPVLFTAADWNPDPNKGQKLADWLIATVYEQHRYLALEEYGNRVVERLLRHGRISLFLDGLDEMSDTRRAAALEAIAAETRFRIVVTSRPEEAEAAVDAGGFPGGVEFVRLQRVPPEVGGAWLVQDQPVSLRDAWEAVAKEMHRAEGGPLASALDTPLWLSFARSCYRVSSVDEHRAGSPRELLQKRFDEAGKIRSHLLERTIQQELTSTRYATSGRRYLESFARTFEPVGFNWWRIRDMAPRLPVVVAVVVAGLAAGIAVGVVGGALHGFLFGVALAFSGAPVGGLVVTTAARRGPGRLRGTVPRQSTAIALGLLYGGGLTVATDLALGRGGSAFAVAAGVCMGVLLGVTIGLVALHDGPMLAARRIPSGRDLQAALIAGAACVFAASLGVSPWRAVAVGGTALVGFAGAVGLTRPDDVPGANMGPLQSYRADLRGSVIFGLIGGSAIAFGAAIGNPHGGLLDSALTGLVSGAAVGIAGMICSSQAVALACIGLWMRLSGNRAPIAIVPFLEFARDRNLIRVAGTAYQFRHRELRDYLLRTAK